MENQTTNQTDRNKKRDDTSRRKAELPGSIKEMADRIFMWSRVLFGSTIALFIVGIFIIIVLLLLAILQGV